MPWNLLFRLGRKRHSPAGADEARGPEPLTHQDTRAAIEELSQAVRNNPESVEIYLALGNLYRSQGEIERAIHIRNSLINRPGLDSALRARSYFELGRDFLRGGMLDKAREAFSLAAKLMGRWRSGAPLVLAPQQDDPALGADPQRNNNFNYKEMWLTQIIMLLKQLM